MNVAIDHCEPFDGKHENIWMKCEHVGRYLFAGDVLTKLAEKRGGEAPLRVLDAACAEGYGTMMLEKNGFSVIGMDLEEAYLAHARQRSGASFYSVDFDRDPFPKEAAELDAVVCFETIEHIEETEHFLAKLHRALKPEGVLMLSFPNADYEKLDENGNNKDPFHKHIFRPEEMREYLRAVGFVVSEEYGQALCNRIVSAASETVKTYGVDAEKLEGLFRFDEESILLLTRLVGYPDRQHVEESYSYIWICRKAQESIGR